MDAHGPIRFNNAADLEARVGETLGPAGPWQVTQELVDAFAELTGDRQWIHVDPERASAGPFGGTIAHGLFTLALGPAATEELVDFGGFAHSLNYGYDKVRFPSPLKVGSRLRMTLEIAGVEPVGHGVQLRLKQTFVVEGQEKPVCVAEALARFVEEAT